MASWDRKIPGGYIDPHNIYDSPRSVAIRFHSTVKNAQNAYKITLENEILEFICNRDVIPKGHVTLIPMLFRIGFRFAIIENGSTSYV